MTYGLQHRWYTGCSTHSTSKAILMAHQRQHPWHNATGSITQLQFPALTFALLALAWPLLSAWATADSCCNSTATPSRLELPNEAGAAAEAEADAMTGMAFLLFCCLLLSSSFSEGQAPSSPCLDHDCDQPSWCAQAQCHCFVL